jgi:hypothetical protein
MFIAWIIIVAFFFYILATSGRADEDRARFMQICLEQKFSVTLCDYLWDPHNITFVLKNRHAKTFTDRLPSENNQRPIRKTR